MRVRWWESYITKLICINDGFFTFVCCLGQEIFNIQEFIALLESIDMEPLYSISSEHLYLIFLIFICILLNLYLRTKFKNYKFYESKYNKNYICLESNVNIFKGIDQGSIEFLNKNLHVLLLKNYIINSNINEYAIICKNIKEFKNYNVKKIEDAIKGNSYYDNLLMIDDFFLMD